MKILTSPISITEDDLLWDAPTPKDCLFFDIETTGLSWRRSHLYLLGAIFYEDSGWILRQWFCQKPGEEAAVLKDFAALLNTRRSLVHFNGSTFDVPYLMHKYTLCQQEQNWEHLAQIDLYRRFLPYKKLLGMEHMRQKDLEARIGLKREDRFSGKELIPLYQQYLTSADESLLHLLLLHNKEDLEGMVRLLPLLAIPHLFDGSLLDGTIKAHGTDDTLKLQAGFLRPFPLALTLPAGHYTLETTPKDCRITVPIRKATLKLYYPNYKDYYYLPLEDEALHKSVAIYVDKEHRVRAKADTCYKKVTGRFLPQYETLCTPVFREDWKDPQSWFLYDENFVETPDLPARYMLQLLANAMKWNRREN